MRYASFLSTALLCLAATTISRAQIVWTGGASNVWLNTGNWSGGDATPNAAGEVARFNGTSANVAPNLGSETTIGNLEFLTGASAYTLGGSALTIQNSTGSWITHSAGNTQTINNAVTLNVTAGASRTITVGTGSTLTLGSGLSATGGSDTNIALTNAGVINLGGSFGGNQLQQSSTGVLNINASQNAGTYISSNNSGRINWNSNLTNSRSVGLGNSASASGRTFVTTAGVTLAQVNFRGGDNSVNTLGSDIGGAGGTGTVTSVGIENATRQNATHIFSAATNNVLNINGAITGSAGAGTIFRIDGPGTVRFSGAATANTFTVPLTVNSGTLELNKTAGTNAIASGAVTINSGAEMRHSASNQIGDSTPITVSGTMNLQTFSDSVGTVALNGGSITGSGTLSGTAFNVQSGTVSANLNGTAALTKTTAGTLTVTGVGSYTGATNINAGTFEANNTTGSATGSGTVTVTSTLAGNGRVETGANNFVYLNGTLQVGSLAATSGSDFELATSGTGSTVLGASSTVRMDVWTTTGTDQTSLQSAADTLRLFGNLDITSGAILKLTNPNALTFAAGDKFRLLDWAGLGTRTGSWSIDSSDFTLAPMTSLDTSGLYTNGTISVVGIPEPSRAMLVIVGLIAALTRRRRH
jgi:fibronectin-binding autotransporter adhesin